MAVPERLLIGQVASIGVLVVLVVLAAIAALVEFLVVELLLLLVPAGCVLAYIGYVTVVLRQVSLSMVVAVLAAVSGSMLVVFQPYKSVVELFNPQYLYTVQFVFIGLFILVLAGTLYLARDANTSGRTLVLPYLVLLLLVAATVRITEAVWTAPYPTRTTITGVTGSFIPNFCAPDSGLSVLCEACTGIPSAVPGTISCFYSALGVLAVIPAGLITGYLYSQHRPRYQQGLLMVSTSGLGVGLLIFIGI